MSSDQLIIVARNTTTGAIELPLGEATLYSTFGKTDAEVLKTARERYGAEWVLAIYTPTSDFYVGTAKSERPEATNLFGSPTYPPEGEVLEVQWRDRWLRARYVHADSIYNGEEESWWMSHFMIEKPLEDEPLTIPEDTQGGGELPPWRRIEPEDSGQNKAGK